MKSGVLAGTGALAISTSVGLAQVVPLSNGVSGDGSLMVKTEGYGATTIGSTGILFDPPGPLGPSEVSGVCAWFLYAPDERVALAEPFFDLDNMYNLRAGTFDLPMVVRAPMALDSDCDGVDDTLTSAWESMNFAGTMRFAFDLTQTVRKPDMSLVSQYTQTLVITNLSGGRRTFFIHRYNHHALKWDGSGEDETGTALDCNRMIVPFISEPNEPNETSVALTGTPGYVYCAARSGWDPDLGGPDPQMTSGSGYQIWDNSGLPESWENETAGIGKAPLIGSVPGKRPPVFSAPYESSSTLAWELTLEDGESATLTSSSLYGSNGECLPSCPCACDFDPGIQPGVCDIFDFLAFQNGFVTGDPCACDMDVSTCPGVCDIFDFLAFQNEWVSGCP